MRFEPLENRQLLSVGVSGLVWQDVNHDGIRGSGEPPVAGAVVEIYSSTDTAIGNADDVLRGTAITDATGHYSFTGVLQGLNYYEVFRAPVGYTFTSQKVGSDRTVDSDPTSAGVTDMFTSPPARPTPPATLAFWRAPGFGWAQNLANVTSYYTGRLRPTPAW